MTETEVIVGLLEQTGLHVGFGISQRQARADGCDLWVGAEGHYKVFTPAAEAMLTAIKLLQERVTPKELDPAEGSSACLH
jgi:hypothetical protein